MAKGPRGFAIKRTVSMTRTMYLELTAKDIRKRFNLPEDAAVCVRVPGGGDWANMDLYLDEHPVKVEWTETKGGE